MSEVEGHGRGRRGSKVAAAASAQYQAQTRKTLPATLVQSMKGHHNLSRLVPWANIGLAGQSLQEDEEALVIVKLLTL